MKRKIYFHFEERAVSFLSFRLSGRKRKPGGAAREKLFDVEFEADKVLDAVLPAQAQPETVGVVFNRQLEIEKRAAETLVSDELRRVPNRLRIYFVAKGVSVVELFNRLTIFIETGEQTIVMLALVGAENGHIADKRSVHHFVFIKFRHFSETIETVAGASRTNRCRKLIVNLQSGYFVTLLFKMNVVISPI